MKSQWECVLENLGEWVGSFTTIDPQGELVDDVPSVICLEGLRDNQAIHLVLKRFYPLPNSTETYAKEVVWDFSTPPGIGVIYFETGAFSSGGLTLVGGQRFIVEFAIVTTDRRFRTIQQYRPDHQLDRITFVREHRQGTTAPERPQLTIADLLGTWQGTATTSYPDGRIPVANSNQSTLTLSDDGYQWEEDGDLIKISATDDRLFQFERDHQSYQIRLLPDSSYTLAPTQINPGVAFYIEIGWIYQPGQRQRLVRRYDASGGWENVTFIRESLGQ